MKRKTKERDGAIIDRLNRGLPPRDVLCERMKALRAAGWMHHEIAAYYGIAPGTVNGILSRDRRGTTR